MSKIKKGHFLGLDDGYNEYGERNLGTLPRDRTLGYGVPEQPAAYMSGPTDVRWR